MQIITDDFDIKECEIVIKDTEDAMLLLAEFDALSTLVDMFALRMKAELHDKLLKGKRGWDNPETHTDAYFSNKMLTSAIPRDDWVSIANLAAILWNRQSEE